MKKAVLMAAMLLFFGVSQASAVTYQYDAKGQLTAVIYNPGKRIDYTYDAAGNRTTLVISLEAGDFDGSGAADLADAVTVLQVISGLKPAQAMDSAGDVDRDGKIGLPEVLYILQKVAGIR